MRYKQNNERRGVILMVVLALLTLFAIVGISFVLYAQSEATAARVARQAETAQHADIPPEQALAFFLGQLIYDVPDATGYGSALRGHSLARTMYGYNPAGGNVTPYNGPGRLHTNNANWLAMNTYDVDDYTLVNYTWFPADGFARDPEWYTNGKKTTPPGVQTAGTDFYVGANAPYTYPDLNNFFLAAVRSDGTMLTPSYHRSWLFNPKNAFNDLSNTNWTKPKGKYMTLRPRPNEHPTFPPPDDPTGDVKNLVGAPGGNDSIWIDIGAPVMTAPDGTQYKMLFAPLIMDLDNRINVAACGNIAGNGHASRSNQGWFPSEVNLGTLWNKSALTADWENLFLSYAGPGGKLYGKYGPNGIPNSTLFPSGDAAHVYSQGDLDGRDEKGGDKATPPIQLPGAGASAPANSCFPFFPPGYGSGSTAERKNHPAAYAVYKSLRYTALLYAAGNDDLNFRASDIEALVRPNSLGLTPVDSGSSALMSSLLRLCPNSLGGTDATAFQRRNWITPISNELAKPGLSPWIYDPTTAPYAVAPASPMLPPLNTTAIPFPDFVLRSAAPPLPPNTDFTTNWNALAAALGRIDVNQPLPPFPHMASGTTKALVAANARYDTKAGSFMPAKVQAQFKAAMTARQNFAIALYTSLLAVTGVPPPSNLAAPTAADLAPRRWLAQLAVNIVDYIDADEISTPFNFYNSANAPFGTPTSASNYQVAANTTAVTPTSTDASAIPVYPGPAPAGNPDVPTYWVFGTELPRIVINEVLGEYTLPTDPATKKVPTPTFKTGSFNVNVWVELFNTMPLATTVTTTATNNGSTLQPMDSQPVPLYMPASGGAAAYNPYELVIANNNTTANSQGLWYDKAAAPGLNNNVLGTPEQARYSKAPTAAAPNGTLAVVSFTAGAGETATVGAPATANYSISGPGGGLPGQSFMIVGPSATDANNDITVAAGVPAATPLFVSGNMTYPVTFTAATSTWSMTIPPPPGSAAGTAPGAQTITDNTTNGISVLLRRLANPHLPANPFTAAGTLTNPALPPNPYITVDYMNGVTLNGYGDNAAGKLVSINTPASFTAIPVGTSSPNPPASYGKLQPYAAAPKTQYAAQTTLRGAVNYHTLGLQNLPLTSPFTWLVHLDRKLISPMELLHVSGFSPHQLTHRFIVPTTAGNLVSQPYNYIPAGGVPNSAYFQHYVPWFDQTRRLYRLFELLEAHDAASGISNVNGRMPGKININTLWDPPSTYPLIYRAICDPPKAADADNPNFTNANVTAAFKTLLLSRTPGLRTPALSEADRPFMGMCAGVTPTTDPQYPAAYGFPDGNGINHTLLTTGTSGTYATAPPNATTTPPTSYAALQLPNSLANTAPNYVQGAHPYLQNELLTKVYNNFTTRSNTFAVFVTVGFFQVMTNASGQALAVGGQPYTGVNGPPLLGPEIGRSEGRQVRHRMFAIVDRTNLTVFKTTSSTPIAAAASASAPTPTPITLGTISGVNTPAGSWPISVGTMLVIEPGTVNEETVTVTATTPSTPTVPGTITANFLLQHPNPTVTGNPNQLPGSPNPTYSIIQRGNPGPWVSSPYDMRQDPAVVPYYSIID